MDWIQEAKRIFKTGKPEHFTNYRHCDECAEHDETLKNADIDTIGLDELGNPGWDPICFCADEGKRYYLPAFIRLSLETMHGAFYFGQFLFHLEADGEENSLFLGCSREQRQFIASFLEYLLNTYAKEIDLHSCAPEVLKVHQIWSKV